MRAPRALLPTPEQLDLLDLRRHLNGNPSAHSLRRESGGH
jgi:hypothetical protein